MLDDELSFERTIEELERRQTEVEQAQRDLEATTVTGHSADRLVTVHAKGLGGITKVEFDPDVFTEHDKDSLGAAVLEAITDATAASSALFHEAFGDLMELPDLGDAPAGDAEAGPQHRSPQQPAPDDDWPPASNTTAADVASSWARAGIDRAQPGPYAHGQVRWDDNGR